MLAIYDYGEGTAWMIMICVRGGRGGGGGGTNVYIYLLTIGVNSPPSTRSKRRAVGRGRGGVRRGAEETHTFNSLRTVAEKNKSG